MDAITHTLLAFGCMAGCYFWGRYLSKRDILEGVVDSLFTTLEREGFIRTVEDEYGDMELVPISEIENNVRNEMR
tara:strand:+ start:1002 stop:1226 length:225 start_codon:yes stop_codon:yes gene_type:complete